MKPERLFTLAFPTCAAIFYTHLARCSEPSHSSECMHITSSHHFDVDTQYLTLHTYLQYLYLNIIQIYVHRTFYTHNKTKILQKIVCFLFPMYVHHLCDGAKHFGAIEHMQCMYDPYAWNLFPTSHFPYTGTAFHGCPHTA